MTTDSTHAILAHARQRAAAGGLPYAGDVSPAEAWELFSTGGAVLVDVRSPEELKFVGRVPDALPVPWATGLRLERNAAFIDDLKNAVDPSQVVLFLCRSGKRSVFTAIAATDAGFGHAFNILEGFEGDPDDHQQRGHLNGWRYHGLPWIQD